MFSSSSHFHYELIKIADWHFLKIKYTVEHRERRRINIIVMLYLKMIEGVNDQLNHKESEGVNYQLHCIIRRVNKLIIKRRVKILIITYAICKESNCVNKVIS